MMLCIEELLVAQLAQYSDPFSSFSLSLSSLSHII